MNKHIPGPWIDHCDTLGRRFIHRQKLWDDGIYTYPIAQTRGDPWSSKEHLANAKLIAAAPELLEALEGLMGPVIFGSQTDREILCDWGTSGMEHVTRARAAIAKARGETG